MDRTFYRQFRRFGASPLGAAAARWLGAILLAALLVGCGRQSGEDLAKSGDDELRIVSFSPALSLMVVDLGLEDQIVGRTPYCTFLDSSVAVVGDLQRVDYERLLDLRPTHILIQAPRDGADERLLELSEERGWTVGQWSGLNTIEDVEQVLRDMPNVLSEAGSERHTALAGRSADLQNDIALALTPGGADVWRRPTLLVYRLEPIGVFGRQTYLSDILQRLGAENAVEATGWTELSLEDVARMNPPAILCIRPGADAKADPIDAIGAIGGLDIDAVRRGRVALLTDPNAMLPSTSIIATAERVRAVLQSWADADNDESSTSTAGGDS